MALPIADEYYVFLGGHQTATGTDLKESRWHATAASHVRLPEGVMHVENPSFELYSPRTTNLTSAPISFRDRTKVYYYTDSGAYSDMYEFVFACRASKNTDNYYLMKMVGSVKELKEQATKPYNIVSGDNIPSSLNNLERQLVHRYMMMGLHFYWTYVKCGLSRTKIITISTTNQSRVVSAGGHKFEQDEGWVVNTSLIFPGLLIDHYRLESGTMGVNAQLAFTKDPEFRYLVYKYIREVFLAFVKHNLPEEAMNNRQLIAKLETTDGLTDKEIIEYAGNIVGSLLE